MCWDILGFLCSMNRLEGTPPRPVECFFVFVDFSEKAKRNVDFGCTFPLFSPWEFFLRGLVSILFKNTPAIRLTQRRKLFRRLFREATPMVQLCFKKNMCNGFYQGRTPCRLPTLQIPYLDQACSTLDDDIESTGASYDIEGGQCMYYSRYTMTKTSRPR